MSRDIITETLNKAQALAEAGVVTYAQMANETGLKPSRIYQWVGQRRYKPDDGAMKLFEWVARKTLQIAKANDRAIQAAYRAKYREIESRIPADGSNRKDA